MLHMRGDDVHSASSSAGYGTDSDAEYPPVPHSSTVPLFQKPLPPAQAMGPLPPAPPKGPRGRRPPVHLTTRLKILGVGHNATPPLPLPAQPRVLPKKEAPKEPSDFSFSFGKDKPLNLGALLGGSLGRDMGASIGHDMGTSLGRDVGGSIGASIRTTSPTLAPVVPRGAGAFSPSLTPCPRHPPRSAKATGTNTVSAPNLSAVPSFEQVKAAIYRLAQQYDDISLETVRHYAHAQVAPQSIDFEEVMAVIRQTPPSNWSQNLFNEMLFDFIRFNPTSDCDYDTSSGSDYDSDTSVEELNVSNIYPADSVSQRFKRSDFRKFRHHFLSNMAEPKMTAPIEVVLSLADGSTASGSGDEENGSVSFDFAKARSRTESNPGSSVVSASKDCTNPDANLVFVPIIDAKPAPVGRFVRRHTPLGRDVSHSAGTYAPRPPPRPQH